MNYKITSGATAAIDSPFWKFVQDTAEMGRAGADSHFVSLLCSGDDALLARLHLIRAAKETLDLQTFLWTDDESGFCLADELLRAASRGVRVRILVDHWVAAVENPAYQGMLSYLFNSKGRLEIKIFNPIGSEVQPGWSGLIYGAISGMDRVNVRMHNKLFIVDQAIAITGGRNIENDYFDRGCSRNFLDLDVLCIGSEVRKMCAAFGTYWNAPLSKPLAALKPRAVDETRPKPDDNWLGGCSEVVERACDSEQVERALIDRHFIVSNLRFVSDLPPDAAGKFSARPSRCSFELRAFLAGATEKILIQSPYLIIDEAIGEMFRELLAAKPHVRCRVSTNSLATTDNLLAFAAAQAERKRHLEDYRLELFEFRPDAADIERLLPRYKELVEASGATPTREHSDNEFEVDYVHLCIHDKIYCVDSNRVCVGSFNLDPRSSNYNTECFVLIEDAEVSTEVCSRVLLAMEPQNSWAVAAARTRDLRTLLAEPAARLLGSSRLLQFWPFRYASCFELEKNEQPLSRFDSRFYDRYFDVGRFPGVDDEQAQVEASLAKIFGHVFHDLL